jgi:hypothetical protein
MAVLVPHFDLPFRLKGSSFAVVEQDTEQDVENCAEAIIRTPYGFRDDITGFGLPDQTFQDQNLNKQLLKQIVETQEPRVSVTFLAQPDAFDNLIARVTAEFTSTNIEK